VSFCFSFAVPTRSVLDQSGPASPQNNKLKLYFRLACYLLNSMKQLVVKLIKALALKIKSAQLEPLGRAFLGRRME